MVKPDVIINMFLRKKVRSSPPPPSFNLSRARVKHMLWVAGGGCLLYHWGRGGARVQITSALTDPAKNTHKFIPPKLITWIL